MVIVMSARATRKQIEHVCQRIREFGYKPHPIYGVRRTVIGAVGDERGKDQVMNALRAIPGVEDVIPILKPFKLASREFKPHKTVIKLDGIEIGSRQFVVMAGPCSVETREQLLHTARAVKKAGAQILRGGAFKPRTSPYTFQGLEEEGLKLLAEARKLTGLYVITEVLSPEDIDLVASYADILQVGARNMQNFALLKKLGQVKKPVMLKRGMMSTVKEWLLAADYIISHGNPQVILCERGIRTFEEYTRNTLDLSAVPLVRELSHLPIIVDPSHGTGVRSLILPMAKAAVAAGADGLIIEVHPKPEDAFSDGPQSILPYQFTRLMRVIKPYIELEGRYL